MFRRITPPSDLPGFFKRFGADGAGHIAKTAKHVLAHRRSGDRFIAGASSAGFARPDLSWPAYAGLVPKDGLSPIYHFFDRTAGGRGFASKITRADARDYRGGKLTYDEHDGTDFVCPPGMQAVCSAPGILVATRNNFLRGGLTACVDHGGVVTQYTHLAKLTAEIGQPLQRGDVIGLTGHSGFDMVMGFPWVPPHIHFMAWVLGTPVDPFLRDDEDVHAATWQSRNDPRPSGPLASDDPPPSLRDISVSRRAIERALSLCKSDAIRSEIEAATSDAGRAAIIEDSLHHDRNEWPVEARGLDLRPHGVHKRVELTLPLPASEYAGVRVADAPWTRPPKG